MNSIFKNHIRFLLLIGLLVPLSFCSKEEAPELQTEISNAGYTINDENFNLLTRAWFGKNSINEDTFNLSLRAYNQAGYAQQSISLNNILTKEGKQQLLQPYGVNIPDLGGPIALFKTLLDDGLDYTVVDWFILDTTYAENWIDVLEYNENTQSTSGTFQFRAIRDSRFNNGFSNLPDTILIKNGWFEAELR